MEPFSLAVLGGIVATEGVKFLYGQAAEILKQWRARNEANSGNAQAPTIDVPLLPSTALDRPADVTAIDPDLVDANRQRLVALSSKLSPYALGHIDIDAQDAELADAANNLRLLLEGLYGVRLTFKGENRGGTGTRLTVEQKLDAVRGTAVGIDAKKITAGSEVSVRQEVKDVELGGTVTGARIDEVS